MVVHDVVRNNHNYEHEYHCFVNKPRCCTTGAILDEILRFLPSIGIDHKISKYRESVSVLDLDRSVLCMLMGGKNVNSGLTVAEGREDQ